MTLSPRKSHALELFEGIADEYDRWAQLLSFGNDRRWHDQLDDRSLDALVHTYLLRYVDDPPTVLRELARVVRPGGTVASLEFGVPTGAWYPAWWAWTRIGLPTAGLVAGGGWYRTGRFLGPS